MLNIHIGSISTQERWKFRVCAWLVAIWSVGIGMGFNHWFRTVDVLNSAFIRHPLNALTLYFLGVLPAIYVALQWSAKRSDFFIASPSEQLEYENWKNDLDGQTRRLLDWASVAELGGLIPFLGLIVGLLLVGPFLLLTPVLFTEFLASAVSELVFEYAIATHLLSRIGRTQTARPLSYSSLVKSTWKYGLVIFIIGICIGFVKGMTT